MDLVKKYGAAVFSPGYRLAWQRPYPAAFNDCFKVLEYMQKHQSEFGWKKLMVGGESAGGGLAAAVCMMAHVFKTWRKENRVSVCGSVTADRLSGTSSILHFCG